MCVRVVYTYVRMRRGCAYDYSNRRYIYARLLGFLVTRRYMGVIL